MTIDRQFRTSLKHTAEMVIPLANSKNLQIISSVNLYKMDFGALEGDYVADYLPYLRKLQDLQKSGQTSISIHDEEQPKLVYSRANGFVKEMILGLDEPEKSYTEIIVLVVHG